VTYFELIEAECADSAKQGAVVPKNVMFGESAGLGVRVL